MAISFLHIYVIFQQNFDFYLFINFRNMQKSRDTKHNQFKKKRKKETRTECIRNGIFEENTYL